MPAQMADVAPQGDEDDVHELPEPVQLTREYVRECDDLRIEWVDVPEWSKDGERTGTFAKNIGARARDRCERESWEADGDKARLTLENARARWVVQGACDATGTRIFRDEDAEWLGEKDGKAVDRIYEVVQRLSGASVAEEKAAAKNSETTLGDSGSGELPSAGCTASRQSCSTEQPAATS